MPKQEKTVFKKSRGRPAGVKYGSTIPARFEIDAMEALDGWAVKHKVSRSEAIRRLVELGLKAKSRHSRFSYAEERRLIQMAADLATMEEAAAAFETSVETIERKAGKLGLRFKVRADRR
jgi:hypothetical protein